MRLTFVKLTRLLSNQGEQGWVASRTAMALAVALLIALLGGLSRDLAAQATAPSTSAAHQSLDDDRVDVRRAAARCGQS